MPPTPPTHPCPACGHLRYTRITSPAQWWWTGTEYICGRCLGDTEGRGSHVAINELIEQGRRPAPPPNPDAIFDLPYSRPVQKEPVPTKANPHPDLHRPHPRNREFFAEIRKQFQTKPTRRMSP